MANPDDKSDSAFRTIGELAEELGLPQHILRYWETRFPQLRPLQRAGNRRYYRPADVALAKRIDRLLNAEGYTVKGVQKLLAKRAGETEEQTGTPLIAAVAPVSGDIAHYATAIQSIRNRLKRALEADDIAARV
jgi:DNA-binding transcriptional MerR regulator